MVSYAARSQLLHNPHAGELLLEEFMQPTGTDLLVLSEKTEVSVAKLRDIVEGKSDISESVDEKLCKFFSLSKGFFLRLQETHNEMEESRKKLDK